MDGTSDIAKGRIKEAAGALTGNKKLKSEGQADQSIGRIKQATQKAADKIKKITKKVRG